MVLSQGINMRNMKVLPLMVQKLINVGQRSQSRSKKWYWLNGLVTKNTHDKYESPTSYGSKVMINVGQRSQSRSQGQKNGTD